MKESQLSPTTFVIRFWREHALSGGRWRGDIEHIPSGRRGCFLRWKDLLEYFQVFDIDMNQTNGIGLDKPCDNERLRFEEE